jgi:hypothetical protein
MNVLSMSQKNNLKFSGQKSETLNPQMFTVMPVLVATQVEGLFPTPQQTRLWRHRLGDWAAATSGGGTMMKDRWGEARSKTMGFRGIKERDFTSGDEPERGYNMLQPNTTHRPRGLPKPRILNSVNIEEFCTSTTSNNGKDFVFNYVARVSTRTCCFYFYISYNQNMSLLHILWN